MEYFILFILFLAVLGLCCCAGPSLVAANKDHSLGVVRGCLVTEVSLIVLWPAGPALLLALCKPAGP